MECIYMSFLEKKWINRGFLNGPFCIIYGFGAIFIFYFFYPFKDSILNIYIIGCIFPTIFEYIVGYIMEYLFKEKWWDYSENIFNYKGRICLFNSLIWGILTVLLFYILEPCTNFFISKINPYFLNLFCILWMIYFMFDFLYSFRKAWKEKHESFFLN